MSKKIDVYNSEVSVVYEHEDGFHWTLVLDKDENPIRARTDGDNCYVDPDVHDSYLLVGRKKYIFKDGDLVFFEQLPTKEDVSERLTILTEKLKAHNTRAVLIAQECDECEHMPDGNVYFIWPKGDVYEAGCSDLWGMLQDLETIDEDGYFIGTHNDKEEEIKFILNCYMSELDRLEKEIGEWL